MFEGYRSILPCVIVDDTHQLLLRWDDGVKVYKTFGL
jgi:hypothetical protein